MKTNRRQFLTGAAAISVAAACPTLTRETTGLRGHWLGKKTKGFSLAPVKAEGTTITYDPSLYPIGTRLRVISTGALRPKGELHVIHVTGEIHPWFRIGETITREQAEAMGNDANGYVHYDLEAHAMQRLHRVRIDDGYTSSSRSKVGL